MVDPERIVSALLAAGVAGSFVHAYLGRRGADRSGGAAAVPSLSGADEPPLPARERRCMTAGHLPAGRPAAERSPGTARPYARRRPQRRANRNP